MDATEFRHWSHRLADWMADYLEQVESYPVRSQAAPGSIFSQVPPAPPAAGEPMEAIFADFERIVMPGITHWQSPNFFAYFPANTSYPSLLAEMLTAALGVQGMIWETSPAAAELEEAMMNWLRGLAGLPAAWSGVIQSTASEATLAALLTAREQASEYGINESGFAGQPVFRVYASGQAHSSIEKGVKIAGFGRRNVVKIPVDEAFAMRPEALEAAIQADLAAGLRPCCAIAALGTTSSTAMDPLRAIGEICRRYGIWLHVDAAYAGSAFILPECRSWLDGIELADSFVFNPHKWLFTHFDCSAYFVRDPGALVRTFEILPEYLKTAAAGVNNYRDWGIPLGRRFRALKLWFVMRSFGAEGMQARLREHLRLGQLLAAWVDAHPDFERLAPVPLNLVCFRWHPQDQHDPAALDALNEQLLSSLNLEGRIYLTHTRLNGVYTLRMVMGHPDVTEAHVRQAWELIQARSAQIAAR
ncbi:MAG: aminotransferase class I/II-fold pyridoxal phosphate-dependent enzyme [Bacteroidia bacterium]|nr:aminotransferase class I/II-fold pyridoxal phosphate-dependent enzyme [Bacteroidia bacterium]